jgi:hypothetical protein
MGWGVAVLVGVVVGLGGVDGEGVLLGETVIVAVAVEEGSLVVVLDWVEITCVAAGLVTCLQPLMNNTSKDPTAKTTIRVIVNWRFTKVVFMERSPAIIGYYIQDPPVSAHDL